MNVAAPPASGPAAAEHQHPVVSPRAVLLTLAGVVALAVVSRAAEPSAVRAALALAAGALTVGGVPGALMMLAWHGRLERSLLEFVAASIALSFGLTQGLTIVAMTLHLPTATILAGVAVAGLVLALRAAKRSHAVIVWSPGQLILAALIAALAVLLYLVGSKFELNEDLIHVAIVRRLAFLPNPALDNVYYLPGFVYTYPYPGTHYFMALVSRVSDLDPMFVYHKLRMFWGGAALTLLYACARRIFESPRVAMASAVTAVILTANGSFADVDGYYWGQLAPFSHASDVAMGVLLPALVLAALSTLQARGRGELVLGWVMTGGLLLMLLIAHIREVVQFAVYLTAFTLTLFVTRRDRMLRWRALSLVVVTVAAAVGYNLLRAEMADGVASLIASDRVRLLRLLQEMTPLQALGSAASMVGRDYMSGFDMFFRGWNPAILLAGVSVLWLLRGRPGVRFLASGIIAYVLIVRFAAVAVMYVYATYFEILYTPVRNVIFFIHMLAGAVLFIVSMAIGRQPRWRQVALGGVAAVVLVGAYVLTGSAASAYNDLLWLPVLMVAAAAVIGSGRRHEAETSWLESTPNRAALAVLVVLLTTMAGISWTRPSSPLSSGNWSSIQSPAALFAGRTCREEVGVAMPDLPDDTRVELGSILSCRPSRALVDYAHARLPVDAVFAVDRFDQFPPAAYLPQQMDTWPGRDDGLIDTRTLFANYFDFYDRAAQKYRNQPFFNAEESLEERLQFVRTLGVTHVLVNPRSYAMMSRVLGALPDTFRRDFDDGEWAVYQVVAR